MTDTVQIESMLISGESETLTGKENSEDKFEKKSLLRQRIHTADVGSMILS